MLSKQRCCALCLCFCTQQAMSQQCRVEFPAVPSQLQMPITSASLDRLPHSIYKIEWYSVIGDFSNDVHRGVWGVGCATT